MATWPANVPLMAVDGTIKAKDARLRTQMSAGPDKVRSEDQSAQPETIENPAGVVMSKAATDSLETFYVTTTLGGVDTFTATHPRTGASVTMRFVSRPSYRLARPDPDTGLRYWRAFFSLEVLL